MGIIPWWSGYRDPETGEMHIDTNYIPAIVASLEGGITSKYDDFRLVIPMSRIISARLFRIDVYNRFFSEEDQEGEDYE